MNEVLQVLVQNGRYTEALDEIELCVALKISGARPLLRILLPGTFRRSHTRTIPSFTFTLGPSVSICLRIPRVEKTTNHQRAFSRKPRLTLIV